MIDRRTFAKASIALPLFGMRSDLAAAPDEHGWLYEGDCGVASGDPSADSVVLWTRVPAAFRRGLGPGETIAVRYEVAATPDFGEAQLVASGELPAGDGRDFTVRVRARGLEPFTTYYYRFLTSSGYVSVTGRTKTLPGVGSSPERIRLGAVTCQKKGMGYYTAYAALCREDLDFCVHLGDHIYEQDHGGFNHGDPLRGRAARNLTQYRLKYRYYLSDPHFREARRLFAWIDLWDDHEVFNDYSGATARFKYKNLFVGAYQAFLDYMPLEQELVVAAGGAPSTQTLYRSYAFGDLLELFVMDQRQYRTPNQCGHTHFTRTCPSLYAEAHTMLGTVQKAWLKDALGKSRCTWKVLANEVMMAPLHAAFFAEEPPVGGKPLAASDHSYYLNLDQWDGFPSERYELLNFIESHKIANVIVLSGDIHAAIDSYLYTDHAASSGTAAAVEIITTSITSQTLGERFGPLLDRPGSEVLLRANQHINWADLDRHGYTVLDITGQGTSVVHVAVETILRPESRTQVARSVRIPAGKSQFLA